MNSLITQIQKNLLTGEFLNEASVSQGIVLPILQELGWPIFQSRVVSPEYFIQSKRVDYALCHPPDHPIVLIEVKMVGNIHGADRQLFEYAFHQGVPLVVLTDGQEWSFYLPGGQGSYIDRRVYKLDFLERDVTDTSERLSRYLDYERVKSGEALEASQADYQDKTRIRLAKENLPRAWKQLLEEQDEVLLELLSDKVEDICGFKPDIDSCAKYIFSYAHQEEPLLVDVGKTTRQRKVPKRSKLGVKQSGSMGFTLRGKFVPAKNARDVMRSLLVALYEENPSFLERYASRKHGRKRRYIARDKYDLYPDRPDLSEEFSEEIVPGWWLGLNFSKRTISRVIIIAAEVAGLVESGEFDFNLE